MLETLRVEDFVPLLGQDIEFRAADGSFTLRLVEAAPLKQPSPRPQPPFRLLLASASGQRLPQGVFGLLHPAHGELHLLMVPIQPDTRGPLYELIFN